MQLLCKKRCFAPRCPFDINSSITVTKEYFYRKVQKEGDMILSFPLTIFYGINIYSATKTDSLAQSKAYR